MKKTVLFIAFCLLVFVGFSQNERPYVIKYQTQGDTVYHNTQFVNGIHIDAQGHELIQDNNTEWSSLMDMDTVYIFRDSEVLNPNYVAIDWNNATLVSANDSIGDYQIQFNGEIPEIQPGSIITIDQDTVVHHRFIETVNVNGNTVSVTSIEAYLTDIFANTEFTLSTADSGRYEYKGKVFYPVAAYQSDEYGVYKTLDLKDLREDGGGFTHDLWHFGDTLDNTTLVSGNNFSIFMVRLRFDFDIDLEMYMNFSGRHVHEIVGNMIDRYRSQALNVNSTLLGSFDTDQEIRCDIQTDDGCSYDPGYDIWKHSLFRPLRVRFVVYGVPVIITLNADLYRQVRLTVSGEISSYVGFTDHAEGRLGFEWRQMGGMSPVGAFSNTFEFAPPPTIEGQGTIEAKVWAFPRVRLLLYDVLGPSFDFKPYLSTTLSGGFKEEMLGQSNDFCAWSLDCNTGLDACCGLSLQFMGYEVQNFSTPNWNIIDRLLYHSPKKIQHVSKSSGQTRTESFNVYDQNHLFNTEVLTPLYQFVKFEADGELSSEYGIAQNGQVTVNWTPTSSDILYAKLYDIDGNVMAWDTVKAPAEPPIVTTFEVTNITQNSAIGGGEVSCEEGCEVTERGICWGTFHNPTTINHHSSGGTGVGSFIVNMTGLYANAHYYVRAYAIVDGETFYGDEVDFWTTALPTVTTNPVTNVVGNTATASGNVTSDGGSPVTERGICWSTSPNPTISNSHISCGTGTGYFTANMTGLELNTTYYVKAYATNSAGTKYGNMVSFTTQEYPDLSGTWYFEREGYPTVTLQFHSGYCDCGECSGDYYNWAELENSGSYGRKIIAMASSGYGTELEIEYCNYEMLGASWCLPTSTYGVPHFYCKDDGAWNWNDDFTRLEGNICWMWYCYNNWYGHYEGYIERPLNWSLHR